MKKLALPFIALAVSLTSLAACDEIPLIQKKGTPEGTPYQGAPDTSLDQEQLKTLRERTNMQRGTDI